MSKISDELRAAANMLLPSGSDGYNAIWNLSDRIDRELVELPKSADGKIWTGREECFWIEARGGVWSRHSLLSLDLINGSKWYVRDTGGHGYEAGLVWHERHDSFERIADELDEQAGSLTKDGYTWQEDAILHDFADRIRNLAKKEDRQCQ